ncbi:MAG: exonuclease domain-containing protein [Eubacteriales bacterium]|nr:exonuclease domain-containing protein [Eubacteriales bacterium]
MDFQYLLGIDTETANSQRISTCSAGFYLKELHGNNIISEFMLIQPDARFSFMYSDMHGIRERDVKNAPKYIAFHERLCEILKTYPNTLVVFHNSTFNIANYYASCKKYQITPASFSFISTSKLSKQVLKRKETYTLSYLCNYFNMPSFKRYFALDEAKMAVMLLEKLMEVTGNTTIESMVEYSNLILGQTTATGYGACVKKDNKKVQVEYFPEVGTVNPLVEGKRFALSKNYSIIPRQRAMIELKKQGGIVSKALTKHCDYYVYDMQTHQDVKTSKVLKIEAWEKQGYHVQRISEQEFLKKLGLLE